MEKTITKLKEKKLKTIKLLNTSSANFDVISIPYYLLWYRPEHVSDVANEYYHYLEENLEYILNGGKD